MAEQSQLGEENTQRSYLQAVKKITGQFQQAESLHKHEPIAVSQLAQKVKSYLKVFNLKQASHQAADQNSNAQNRGGKGVKKEVGSNKQINVNTRKSLTPFQNRKLQQKSIYHLKRERRDQKKNNEMKNFRQPFMVVESLKSRSKGNEKSKMKQEKVFYENLSRIKSGIQFMRGTKTLQKDEQPELNFSKMRSSTNISDMLVLSTYDEKQKQQSHQQELRRTNQSTFSHDVGNESKVTFKRKNSIYLNQTTLGGRVPKASQKIMAKEERKVRNQLRPYLFSRSINSMMKIKSFSKNKMQQAATEGVDSGEEEERGVKGLRKGRSLSDKKNKVGVEMERSTKDLLKLQFKMLQFCGWQSKNDSSQRVLFF